MASIMYNTGKDWLLKNNPTTGDLRAALSDTGYSADPDHDYLDPALGVGGSPLPNEYDGSGYSRQALTTETLTVDDVNNWVEFSSDNVLFGATVAAGTNAANGIVIYVYNVADTACQLIYWGDFTDTNGNGGSFTVNCPSDGWFYV